MYALYLLDASSNILLQSVVQKPATAGVQCELDEGNSKMAMGSYRDIPSLTETLHEIKCVSITFSKTEPFYVLL